MIDRYGFVKRIKRHLAISCAVAVGFSQAMTLADATESRSSSYSSMYIRTGDKATDMVNIALAQQGRTKADFGYTESWCADFVCDCAALAGASDAVPFNGKVSSLYNSVIAAGGGEVSSPEKGDLVFYYCTVDGFVHVGIMADQTRSIEGNYTSKVTVVSGVYKDTHGHSLANGTVMRRFVRPAYNGAVTPAPDTDKNNTDDNSNKNNSDKKADNSKKDNSSKKDTDKKDNSSKKDTDKKDNSSKKDTDKKDNSSKKDTDKKDNSSKKDTDKKDNSSKKDTDKKLVFSKKGAGDYQIATESTPLTLRKTPGKSGNPLIGIPKDMVIAVTKTSGSKSDDWAYTSYKGIKGYVSMDFLKRVKAPKKGDSIAYEDALYSVISVSGKKVKAAYKKNTDAKATSAVIPDSFIRGSYTYTVTSIRSKAFSASGKLDSVEIRSESITSISKNAFKGLDKKTIIKVPEKKLSKYKKLIKRSGAKLEVSKKA
ncbi:hypothetical protein [Candidatus Weimeria sp. HCP3S3_B5]|uniref:hypothetical protein n=1 Tax=Candidatus Weimeria sp. HCP3S3_B5 TaxID=3438871 RepID=UPI003F8BB51D